MHCGKKHDYLGMELEYTNNGELIVGMVKNVEKMIKKFPMKLSEKDTALTPAGDNLVFDEGKGKKLSQTYFIQQLQKDYSCAREQGPTYNNRLQS